MKEHIRFKACPRCRGDVALQADQYGHYWDCLSCGAIWDVVRGTATAPVRRVG